MKMLLDNNIGQIMNEYYTHENSFLCKKYMCCDETLRKFLRKNNVACKKTSQITENENFFKIIDSEEKAYFLGFICADGSIQNKRNKLSFTLKSIDVEILLTLKALLKTTTPVTKRTHFDKRNGTIINSVGTQIYSRTIVEDLHALGIGEDKSHQVRLPQINKNLIRHFLRGLFDGDGHIGGQCSQISTRECLNDIILFLKEFDIKPINFWETINESKNVHKIYFGKDRIKFLNLLYKDASIFLLRKYEIYLRELKRYDNQIIGTETYHSIISLQENIIFSTTKECAEHEKIGYCHFTAKLKRGDYSNKYSKHEIITIKTKRNGEKLINKTKY
jgi:hypothetical protein